MADTIQVVRVEDIGSLYVSNGMVWMAWAEPPGDFIVGDVIELTEEQSNFPGGNIQGRRWVSKRKVEILLSRSEIGGTNE